MRRTRFFLVSFMLLLVSGINSLYAQICVDIDVPTYHVMTGTSFLVTVKVTNIPKDGILKILANGDEIFVSNGVADIIFSNNQDVGQFAVDIEVIVMLNKARIFSQEKKMLYVVYSQVAAISSSGQDYFYKGIETEITIAANGIIESDLNLRIYKGGFCSKSGPGKYIIRTDGERDDLRIAVFAKITDSQLVNVFDKTFRMIDLPQPILSLNKSLLGLITADTIQINTLIPADLAFSVEPIIIDYTCLVWSGNQWRSFSGNGSFIKDDLKAAIQLMESGDILYFNHIGFRWGSAKKIPLMDGSFTLTK